MLSSSLQLGGTIRLLRVYTMSLQSNLAFCGFTVTSYIFHDLHFDFLMQSRLDRRCWKTSAMTERRSSVLGKG